MEFAGVSFPLFYQHHILYDTTLHPCHQYLQEALKQQRDAMVKHNGFLTSRFCARDACVLKCSSHFHLQILHHVRVERVICVVIKESRVRE